MANQFTKAELIAFLVMLADDMVREDREPCKVVIAGGSAMSIEYDYPEPTKDLDMLDARRGEIEEFAKECVAKRGYSYVFDGALRHLGGYGMDTIWEHSNFYGVLPNEQDPRLEVYVLDPWLLTLMKFSAAVSFSERHMSDDSFKHRDAIDWLARKYGRQFTPEEAVSTLHRLAPRVAVGYDQEKMRTLAERVFGK